MRAQLPDQAFRFLPAIGETATNTVAFTMGLPLATFIAFIGVQWWASWYPGAEPGGGGYVAQRMMSAKDERHSLLATLWFTVAHYCVRPWPWILVGLASVVLYPGVADREAMHGIVRQLVRASVTGESPDEVTLSFMLSMVRSIRPRDPLEAMLVAQMVSVHVMAMRCAHHLADADDLAQHDSAARALGRLARTFPAQIEALNRHPEAIRIRVQQVHDPIRLAPQMRVSCQRPMRSLGRQDPVNRAPARDSSGGVKREGLQGWSAGAIDTVL